jgi:lysophospholipase L1-like esterase
MRASGYLTGALILIVVAAVADWLGAETTRLYAEKANQENAQSGSVRQEFKIHGRKVRPEITAQGDARFGFPIDKRVPSRLVFAVEMAGSASYEIFVRAGGKRQRIAAGEGGERQTNRSISLPARVGELEFVQHGSIRWIDLRLVRPVFLWPIYVLAFGVTIALAAPQMRSRRFAHPEWVLLLASTLLCLTTVEFGLRRFSRKLPAAVTAARGDLGAVGADPRWIDPGRYKLRLRPNLKTYNEWRYGAIVRLGFIPKEVSRGLLHRFALRTDAEGFRNEKVRAKIDVATLGDSFTDATTGPVEESWPAYLEKMSGLAVQNYGTSGFGPQQELYALRDFALGHHPRWVILAFYGGNDLHDAEIFDRWEREHTRENYEREGWELARAYRRYETLYLWTLVRVGVPALLNLVTPQSDRVPAGAEAAVPERPTFDRGMFNVPVANHAIQFAFLPPYLRQLGVPRPEIEASPGWQLTAPALRKIKEECETNGARLLLVFVPEKAQVCWPLAERSFTAAELQGAINFYCPPGETTLTLDAIHAHRLALNEVLQDFCATERIPMLDLTAPLEREVDAGREMYFPDDTHWSAAGHEVAARQIAEFLAGKP